MIKITAFLATVVLLSSCDFKAEVKTSSNGAAVSTSASTSPKIKNGIDLKANGLTVSQAFLIYEDGTLVGDDNTAKVGQKIKMRLVIDGGWQEAEGRVYPGASEKIETNEGDVVLDEKDLFASMETGVAAEDAKLITLSAVITGLDKLHDYFLVTFRVWDKKGTAEVTGKL